MVFLEFPLLENALKSKKSKKSEKVPKTTLDKSETAIF